MENMEGRRRAARILRIIARVIGTIMLTFFLALIIGDAVQSIQSDGFNVVTGEMLFILIPAIIALASFVLSWWFELIGGILLVFSYLLLSFSPAIHSIYYGPKFEIFLGMFAFASPFLIVAILLIIAWWLSRESLPGAG
jgi:hypothetical protein